MNDDEPDAQGDPVTHLARKPRGYRSYILRCWEAPSLVAEQHADKLRFSLEDPSTGEHRGFANIQALAAFLQTSMTTESTTTHPPERTNEC